MVSAAYLLPKSNKRRMMRNKTTVAYIGVGSNLGDRKGNIEKARKLVNLIKDTSVKKNSSIHETEPVGGPMQGAFLNGVMEIETRLDPLRLLEELKHIEAFLGRKRALRNGPRTIDLDILLYGDKRIKKRNLVIPHPRMHKREFVLRGLREIKRGQVSS